MKAISVVPVIVLAAAFSLTSCSDETPVAPPIVPTPTPAAVSPGDASGAIAIAYTGSNILPGSTVSGCGSDISGCRGRMWMSFRLTPSVTGTSSVIRLVFQTATKGGCLSGTLPAPTFVAGQAQNVVITLDGSVGCPVPAVFTHMWMNIEGPVGLTARQEWGVSYRFEP
jgi:predicted small secreted protein